MRPYPRIALATATTGLLATTGLSLRNAHACACCDYETTRVPLGWGRFQDEVLVGVDDNAACEKRVFAEVWTDSELTCVDQYGDPLRQISCDEVTLAVDNPKTGEPPQPKAIGNNIRKRFVYKSTPLPPNRFSLRTQLARNGDEELLAVEFRAKHRWAPLYVPPEFQINGKITSVSMHVPKLPKRGWAPSHALLIVQSFAKGATTDQAVLLRLPNR